MIRPHKAKGKAAAQDKTIDLMECVIHNKQEINVGDIYQKHAPHTWSSMVGEFRVGRKYTNPDVANPMVTTRRSQIDHIAPQTAFKYLRTSARKSSVVSLLLLGPSLFKEHPPHYGSPG